MRGEEVNEGSRGAFFFSPFGLFMCLFWTRIVSSGRLTRLIALTRKGGAIVDRFVARGTGPHPVLHLISFIPTLRRQPRFQPNSHLCS